MSESIPVLDISSLVAPSPPRTRGYYVSLVGIASLYLITPLSWAYLAYTALYRPRVSGLSGVLLVWSILEAAFSTYHHHLARTVQALPPNTSAELALLRSTFLKVLQYGLTPAVVVDDEDGISIPYDDGAPPAPSVALEDMEMLAEDDPRAIDFRNRMRTWFRRVPWSHITQEAMLTWLAWLCYELPLASASSDPGRRAVLHDTLALVQKRSGTVLPTTSAGPKVTPLRLTMDPVVIWSRPLVLYVFLSVAHRAVIWEFQRSRGFTKISHEGMEFLLRLPPSPSSPSSPSSPVIFVHGLGIGLLQYRTLLTHFASELPSHPLLVPLQPHISQDLWHSRHLSPPGRKETVRALRGVILMLGWGPKEGKEGKEEGGVTFVSHSNGSVAHAWMLKECPELLRRSCFIDPVTFCLWEGDVCYNFLYRSPTTALELLTWYFVGCELGTANLLQRHFVWSSNVLWFDELKSPRDPYRSFFLLAGRDAIVDADRVYAYLRSHGVRKGLVMDPDAAHGTAILTEGKGLRMVIDWVGGEGAF